MVGAGGVQVTCFTDVSDESTLHFQIIKLGKQIYAWVGAGSSAKLGHLYAAASTRPNNSVSVTNILGGASDNTGSSIARRIVSRTSVNVILACNIPKNNPSLEADVEKKLLQKLISLGLCYSFHLWAFYQFHIQLQRERESMMSEAYGDASYWDKRYAQQGIDTAFDWYQKYHSLSPILHLYLPNPNPNPNILVVGCGNSAFSEAMVEDGYENVVSIDISSVVIQSMIHKYPQLNFLTMDVRDMSAFQTGSFDAVIDKGTLDSLLCGSNSRVNAAKMLEEVGRVLKDKGVYILITYGAPTYRLCLLRDSVSWTIKLHIIGKSLGEGSSEEQKCELTTPIPLDGDESTAEAALGKNADVHYIYVCTKDESLRPGLEHQASTN